MLRKEIKGIIKNPVYFIIMLLPFILTFIMSEGTKNYLLQHLNAHETVNTTKEIIAYKGIILDAKIQFAVSELNFMLMMCAILAGLSIFEERRLHIWDRMVEKKKFVLLKFFTHYGFSVFMVAFNLLGFLLFFDIVIPLKSVLIFFSVPVISILFGLFIGTLVGNRAMLSNSILMVVMLLGFFGGAWSLTSVLANTRFMNIMMYLSPLTMANKLIFKDLINIHMGTELLIWIAFILIFVSVSVALIGRRVKNGAII